MQNTQTTPAFEHTTYNILDKKIIAGSLRTQESKNHSHKGRS